MNKIIFYGLLLFINELQMYGGTNIFECLIRPWVQVWNVLADIDR